MATTKRNTEPPLVNHRWHLPSLGEVLDRLLPEWPEGEHPDFSGPDGHAKMRGAFEQFGERLLSSLEISLEKAAGKGIAQALQLIRDPSYAKTIKRRTKIAIEKQKADFARQDRWRERWKRCEFTETERRQEIGRIVRSLNYHQKQVEELNARKMQVESGKVVMEEVEPQPEEFKARSIKYDPPDDNWPDTISFD